VLVQLQIPVRESNRTWGSFRKLICAFGPEIPHCFTVGELAHPLKMNINSINWNTMKTKNMLHGLAMAVVWQLGMLAGSAQSYIYTYTGNDFTSVFNAANEGLYGFGFIREVYT
jgi:hypothetical protein